jgi:hypothetical protein
MSSGCRGNIRRRWFCSSSLRGGSWTVDCDVFTVKRPLDANLDRSARPKGRRCAGLACAPIKITLKGV